MNGRRLLGETLGEIVTGAIDAQRDVASLMKISSLELDLPIDIRLAIEADGPVLIGDVPLVHERTIFDPPPMRLGMTIQTFPGDVQ